MVPAALTRYLIVLCAMQMHPMPVLVLKAFGTM